MLQLEEHLFVLKDLLASVCNLLNKQALIKDTILQYIISPDIRMELRTPKLFVNLNKPQTWVIALTANALEEDRQICFDSGMNDFISKPIAVNELKRIMSDYVKAK